MLYGDKFPEKWPFAPVASFAWSWVKYYRENTQRFYIPKNPNYVNMEILANALNGKIIDTNKKYIQRIKYDIKAATDNYRKIESDPV